jgi:hypothetical protein
LVIASLKHPGELKRPLPELAKEADMNAPSTISLGALLACLLVGYPAVAQESVAPATAAQGNPAVDAQSDSVPDSPVRSSKVRIVRLSQVKGEVRLDRLTGKGLETAMANLPVIEGARLETLNGIAEVEFEDNSTIRLAPNSLVEFPQLELLPGGAKASTVQVLQGMVYVSLVSTKGNHFEVKFGQEAMSLPPDSHIRLQVGPTEASLAVMHGEVAVTNPAGSTMVGKNRTATFQFSSTQTEPVVEKSYTEEATDRWDSDATQYHKSFANASSFGGTPYSYGVPDLNYYGSFVGGCGGSFWRPYFASAAWDPYGSGAWAYYAGAGYSWVSPYPWGWTPYHYGSWSFCNGIGWGWVPGGAWMGLANYSYANSPAALSSAVGTHPIPRPPVHGPSEPRSMVPVNLKEIPASSVTGEDKFVFRKDSAGMGVPRGSLGKLNGFSNHVSQHGMASTTVFYPSPSRAEAGRAGSSFPTAGRSEPGNAASRGEFSHASSSGSISSGSAMHSAPAGGSSGGSAGGGGHR